MRDRSKFQKGSGCYNCQMCGKMTRSTGRGDNENVRLCVTCYDMAGDENAVADGQMTQMEFENRWFSQLVASLKIGESLEKKIGDNGSIVIGCEPNITAPKGFFYLATVQTSKLNTEQTFRSVTNLLTFIEMVQNLNDRDHITDGEIATNVE